MSKYRHEYKYLLNTTQEALLRMKTATVMKHDAYVFKDGSYMVRSVYFDDADNSCLQDNLSGVDPRSKFRIRYYNSDINRLRLERKHKRRGMCLKDACLISREECEVLLNGKTIRIREDMDTCKKELLTELSLRNLKPVTIVTYERIPFVYSGGNVRVTFDRKLTSSTEINRFLSGDYLQYPVFMTGQSMLEVKWDEALPVHIRETLQIENLQWTAFSKYSACRIAHSIY